MDYSTIEETIHKNMELTYQLGRHEELIEQIHDLIFNSRELNLCNYTHDDVEELNDIVNNLCSLLENFYDQ